jgi:HK97 family phage prohead protease
VLTPGEMAFLRRGELRARGLLRDCVRTGRLPLLEHVSDSAAALFQEALRNYRANRVVARRAAPCAPTAADRHRGRLPVVVGCAVRYTPGSVTYEASEGGGLTASLERFAPGAFTDFLERDRLRVPALLSHDAGRCVGSTHGGQLDLWEEPFGLVVRLRPADNRAGRALVAVLREHGSVGMSLGFGRARTREERQGGRFVRVVEAARLVEVTFCTDGNGANPWTVAALRCQLRRPGFAEDLDDGQQVYAVEEWQAQKVEEGDN